VCVCAALPPRPLATSTHVLVLQHPNERRRKTVSTVKLLPLCLEHVTVKVGYQFDAAALEPLQAAIRQGRRPLLLFPGPGAVPLDGGGGAVPLDGGGGAVPLDGGGGGAAPGLRLPDGAQTLLVLIDGTWQQAKRVFRDSPSLAAATTQVAFAGEASSAFDVLRKEPDKHCVSTLEACCRALRLLEPDSASVKVATDYLEGSLRELVDVQLACVGTGEVRFKG